MIKEPASLGSRQTWLPEKNDKETWKQQQQKNNEQLSLEKHWQRTAENYDWTFHKLEKVSPPL